MQNFLPTKMKILFFVSLVSIQNLVFASEFSVLKLNKDNKTIYLIGSIHVGNAEIEDKRILDLVSKSKSICFEADPQDIKTALVVKEAVLLNPTGVRLKDRVGDVLFNKIKDHFISDKNFIKHINIYSPFSIAAALLNLNPEIRDLNKLQTSLSMDNYIKNIANKKKIPIKGIEDSDALIRSVNNISNLEWQEYLNGVMEIIDCPKCVENYTKYTKQSYVPSKDPEAAYTNQMRAFGNAHEAANVFDKLFYGKRNQDMARNIEEQAFKQNKCDVIAIGAGHLGGENGLVKLMKEREFLVNEY